MSRSPYQHLFMIREYPSFPLLHFLRETDAPLLLALAISLPPPPVVDIISWQAAERSVLFAGECSVMVIGQMEIRLSFQCVSPSDAVTAREECVHSDSRFRFGMRSLEYPCSRGSRRTRGFRMGIRVAYSACARSALLAVFFHRTMVGLLHRRRCGRHLRC